MWPDGYIREFALNKITNGSNNLALKLIMLRLNDWSKPVHLAALNKFFTKLPDIKKEVAIELVPNLATLRTSCRHLEKQHYQKICDQLLKKIDSKTVCNLLTNPVKPATERRSMAEIMWFSELENEHDILKALLQTPDSYIRFHTLRKIVPKLPLKLQEELILNLPNTNWAPVKIERLNVLKRINAPRLKDALIQALSDSSGTVRQFAQYYLAKESFDFTSHYQNLLEASDPKTSANALKGLATMNSKIAAPIIEKWLKSNSKCQLVTALYLIANVDPEEHTETIHQALRHPLNQIKRAAYHAALKLKDRSQFLEMAIAPEHHICTQTYATKLLLSSERWISFNAALKLLSHDKEKIQSMAKQYIGRFNNSLFHTFTKPSKQLQEEILKQLNNPNLSLEKQTLKDLEFRLKGYLDNKNV